MSTQEDTVVLKMSEFKSIHSELLNLKNEKYSLESSNKKMEIELMNVKKRYNVTSQQLEQAKQIIINSKEKKEFENIYKQVQTLKQSLSLSTEENHNQNKKMEEMRKINQQLIRKNEILSNNLNSLNRKEDNNTSDEIFHPLSDTFKKDTSQNLSSQDTNNTSMDTSNPLNLSNIEKMDFSSSLLFQSEELEQLKKKLEQQAEEFSQERQKYLSGISQRDSELDNIKKQFLSYKQQSEEKLKGNENLISKLQTTTQNNSKELEKHQKQIQDLKDLNQLKTTQMKKLKETSDGYSNELQEKEKKIEQMHGSLSNSQQTNIKNNQEKNDLQEKINQLNQQCEKLKNDLNSMQDKYNLQMNAYSEQKNNLKGIEEKFNTLHETHTETKENHDNLIEEKNKLQEENKKLQQSEKITKEELLDLQNKFEQTSFDFHSQIENLRSQKINLEEQVYNLNETINKTKEKLLEKEDLLGVKEKENEELKENFKYDIEEKNGYIKECETKISDINIERQIVEKKQKALIKELQSQLRESHRSILSMGTINNNNNNNNTSSNSWEMRQNSPPKFSSQPMSNEEKEQTFNHAYQQLMEDNDNLIHKVASLQQLKFDMKERIISLVEQLENKTRLLQEQIPNLKILSRNTHTTVKKNGDNGKTPSIEVIDKLGIILEDTLSKNMQLQNDMVTLGEEISKLSIENNNLKREKELKMF